MKAVFDSLQSSLAGRQVVHVVLMVDKIVQEKRPWWCDRTNTMLGWCREHTKKRCMEFNSIADAELLFDDMVLGNVHLAHEVSSSVPMLTCTRTCHPFTTGHCWCNRFALQ